MQQGRQVHRYLWSGSFGSPGSGQVADGAGHRERLPESGLGARYLVLPGRSRDLTVESVTKNGASAPFSLVLIIVIPAISFRLERPAANMRSYMAVRWMSP